MSKDYGDSRMVTCCGMCHRIKVIAPPEEACTCLPALVSLDMHGVDDDDVYHAPSRARYEEMQATIKTLEARVTELQADNTKIETDRRKHKTLYEVARKLLGELLVDVPLMNRLSNADPMMERAIAHDLPMVEEVLKRNEQLEADAWCGATAVARLFVDACEKILGAALTLKDEELRTFVEQWREQFAEVLKR